MNFEEVLANLFEKAIASFNTGDYDNMQDLLFTNANLISPEIKKGKFYAPAIHANNRDEIFAYWKKINAEHDNRITDMKFIKTGKVSIIRCFYGELDFILDSHIYIDEYGIVFKIINELVETEEQLP